MARIYRCYKILDYFDNFSHDRIGYTQIEIMLDLKKKFKNKKILIYGLGKSGLASFNYLKKENFLNIFDDYKKILSKKFKKYSISKNKLIGLNFDYIVISPGIDIDSCKLKSFLNKNRNKIISELDIFYLENPKNKKITITGTNGKSTTSKLLHDILRIHKKDVRLVGNIGNPLLSEKHIKPNTIFVIEASSYQIEYSKYFETDYAIILNISPDHLERHGNFKNYIKAKFKLFLNQKRTGYSFFENKNYEIKKILTKHEIKSKIVRVKTKLGKKIINKISNDYFKNLNNQKNLAFILSIGEKLKLSKEKIFKVVNSFKELKYRQQILYKNKRIIIINDSKSTSFSSSENLLKSYKNIYWIVGGRSKKGDRFLLNKRFLKNISAYIFGKNKNFFINKFKGKIKFKVFSNISQILTQIVKDFKKDLNPQMSLIFSPSAASFDQFDNFEHRGKYFNKMINKRSLIKKLNEK